MSQKYKPLLNIAKILGSGFLLFFALIGLDWAKFGQVLVEVNPLYLLLAPLVYAINNTFSALRWQNILQQWDIKPGIWRLWKIYLISSFWGNFLPSTIGGDGYRFLALCALPNASKTKIFSSLLLDRLYGLITLVVAHFIVIIFYWRELQTSIFLVNIELALLAVVIILTILWVTVSHFFNLDKLPTFALGWVTRIVNKFSEFFALLKQQDWRVSAWGLFFSLLFVGTIAIAWQVFFFVADIHVEWGVAFYVATLTGILGILPITLNGIGITELCLVTILSWQNIPVEKSILAAFITRIMQVLLTLPGGLFYMFDKSNSIITSTKENNL